MAGDKPWPQVPVGNEDHTKATVVIIGAGISGICTAIDLIARNKCRNFVILEKGSGPGGTWKDNRYPGCCCDVWSHLYSFSFEQKPDWTRMYPGQEEILDYLTGVAQKYDLYRHIRFNTCVEELHWDDAFKKWQAKVKVLGGKEAEAHENYTITSDFVVSAVGQLNNPSYPDIPGLSHFKGKKMHSARWDWSYDLTGKRIGLIGNGCTAVQIIPEIAKVADQVTIFQRTPNWIIPRLDAPVSKLWQNIYKYIPPIRKRVRAEMMDYRESFFSAVTEQGSDFEKLLKKFSIDMMHQQLPNQPELWEKLMPNYPVGCKRVIISDDYYPTIAQESVHLETGKIERITEKGIIVDGKETEYDILICATGFKTNDFFMNSLKITGAAGRSLESIWSKGPRALYGVTIESLPNLGVLYGPNTNLGHNSIVLMIEAQSRYINTLIGKVIDARMKGETLTISPKPERLEEYNKQIQDVLGRSSFAHPSCSSWYKTEDGMITQNWSGTVIEYQKLLSTVNWDDYNLSGNSAVTLEHHQDSLGRVVEETWMSYTTIMGITAASVLAVAAGVALKAPRLLKVR